MSLPLNMNMALTLKNIKMAFLKNFKHYLEVLIFQELLGQM